MKISDIFFTLYEGIEKELMALFATIKGSHYPELMLRLASKASKELID